jgi:hypothetical protein
MNINRGKIQYAILKFSGELEIWRVDDLCYLDDDCEYEVTELRLRDLIPEQLGDHIDSDLENANYHSFCRVGKRLATILVENVGAETASRILEQILEEGVLNV